MQSKGKLQDQNAVASNGNPNTEINALKMEIEEKTEEIQGLQTLNHILVSRDFKSNQELQECRKELIKVRLHSLSLASLIKVIHSILIRSFSVCFSLLYVLLSSRCSNTKSSDFSCRACKIC